LNPLCSRGAEERRLKNALFAGSDGGAEHCAIIALVIETCKLHDAAPLA